MNEDQKHELRLVNDECAAAANAGDRDAAGKYLRLNLAYLSSMARWLARGAMEPDDLAAETITSLLAVWSQGKGPISNPNAYLIRSMRNRVIDERRSPRSRVQGISESEEELPPDQMITRDIDLHREYGYVRQALVSLPDDQQQVLRATIIDGRKPAELEGELGRSASAIYSLSHRAKAGLRRATLRVVLTDDAPERCRHAADRLPETIAGDVDDATDSVGMEHIRSCARCRGAWSRFSGMATLGIGTLLVAGNAVGGAAPAQASENPPSSDSAPPTPQVRPAIAKKITPLRVISLLGVVVGIVIIAVTLPAVIGGILPGQKDAEGPGTPAAADLHVTTVASVPGRATLTIELDADVAGDLGAVLSLPAGVTVSQPPEGWSCELGDPVVTCRLDASRDGTFELLDARADQTGTYRLELSGDSGGRGIAGFAEGTITDEEQTVAASVG